MLVFYKNLNMFLTTIISTLMMLIGSVHCCGNRNTTIAKIDCDYLKNYTAGKTIPDNTDESCPVYIGFPNANVAGEKVPASINLALGRKVYVNKLMAWPANAECNIVDGNLFDHYTDDGSDNLNSCIITENLNDHIHWAIVDLANVYHINLVTVTNFNDIDPETMMDYFYVGLLKYYEVGKPIIQGTYALCGQFPRSSLILNTMNVSCEYANDGRYVIIQNTNIYEYMSFCEVEIYGFPLNKIQNGIDYVDCYSPKIENNGKTFPDKMDFNCNVSLRYPNELTHPVPVNIALGRRVFSSSLEQTSFLSGVNRACNAVDGNANGLYSQGTCISTKFEGTVEWVIVDLQNNYNVSSVIISNRMDAQDDKLNNVFVRILSTYTEGQTITPTTGSSCGDTLNKSSKFFGKVKIVCVPEVAAGRYVAVVREGGINFCEIEVYGKADY